MTQRAIVVAVENSGDFQETNVQVTIRILQDPEIKKSKKIASINAQDTQEVTFADFTNINFTALNQPKITRRLTLHIHLEMLPFWTDYK